MDDIIGSVVNAISPILHVPELAAIVRDLIEQLCPWLEPTALVEWTDFALALEIAKLARQRSELCVAQSGRSSWRSRHDRTTLVSFRAAGSQFLRLSAEKEQPKWHYLGWISRRHDIVSRTDSPKAFEDANERLCAGGGWRIWRDFTHRMGSAKDPGERSRDRFLSRLDYTITFS